VVPLKPSRRHSNDAHLHIAASRPGDRRGLLAAAHESVFGTKRTSRGVRSLVAIGSKPDIAQEAQIVVGLLVIHQDFTDEINIHSIGLDHKKFAHDWWLKNNVGDVEIVGNHYQI
jgi:hypothetical protein